MARRKKRKKINNFKDWDFSGPKLKKVSTETKKSVSAVILLLVGILSFFSLIDLAGTLGYYLNALLKALFGVLRWLAPIIFVALGYFLLRPSKYKLKFSSWFGLALFVLSLTGLIHLVGHSQDLVEAATAGQGGGYVGLPLSALMMRLTGFWAGLVLLLAFFVIGLFLFSNTSFNDLTQKGKKLKSLFAVFNEFLIQSRIKRIQKDKEKLYQKNGELSQDQSADFQVKEIEIEQQPARGAAAEQGQLNLEETGGKEKSDADFDLAVSKFKKTKIDLPLSLLNGVTGKPNGGDLEANKLIIQKTLKNFGIMSEMGEAKVGPTVTQYTLKPADGVKLSRITALGDNLSLALAAHPIRIEAPIPGRSLVGVEVPNTAKAIVPLKDILLSDQFKSRNSNLMVSLGLDVMGRPWLADLKKMPHLLIAGSTGSGKSVCINSIILSLLFQNSPADLNFIMVDPKRVELPVYNGIPHLITPVIVDVKKTINALRWTITEMDRRFDLLSKFHKRNIESYNAEMADKIPYLIVVVDELADLMAASAAEVEAAIIRLAQMSRAVGIHLVLATQRPSVDVLTGLIKANITSRIAFAVASIVDSRTILDQAGAEKLLGRGDMLYISSELGKPKRLQGAFASDEEIKKVIDHLKQQAEPEYLEEVTEKQNPTFDFSVGATGEEDELLPEAKEVIFQAKKASASLLQRRLKVGYARAARLLDILEEQGFIGPADGAKPREILINNLEGGTIKDPSLQPTEDQNKIYGGQDEEE